MKRRNFLKALPAAALALAGCGQAETAPANTASLVFDHSYPLDYAAQFSADCYEGGYVLVNIPDSGRFLVIPEDAAEVDDLPADVVPLRQPLDNIYLVSTSVMDLFVHLDERFSTSRKTVSVRKREKLSSVKRKVVTSLPAVVKAYNKIISMGTKTMINSQTTYG